MRSLTARIRGHLRDPESQHGRIASGFAWVLFFLLFGKIAGAAKEITVAWRYGVSDVVDAYVFIYNIVTWPVSVWFGILTLVLVPLLTRVASSDPAEAHRFNRELLGFTVLAGAILVALSWFGLPFLLHSSVLTLPEGTLVHALPMSAVLSATLPIGLCVSLLSARLLANGKHRNSLLEAIPPLAIIVALIVPSHLVPQPLAWGTLAGMALQLVALAHPLRRASALDTPQFTFHSPVWRSFWLAVAAMALGQVLTSLTQLADQFFAADLGTGAISTLGYANRMAMLVLGIAATAIARATLPVLSEAHSARHEGASPVSLGARWALWVFVIGTGVTALAIAVASHGVRILFERGAFHHESTVVVTTVLRHLLLQTPFYGAGLVLVSVLAAQGRYSTITAISAITFTVKLVTATLLVDRFQLVGLAWSTVLMYVTALALLSLAVWRQSSVTSSARVQQ